MSDASLSVDWASSQLHLDPRVEHDRAAAPAAEVITLIEIRVLTGLSRGAALPIESSLFIGADPECEIFLLDPGVADRHLRVEVDANGRVMVLDLTTTAAEPVEQPELRPFQAGDVRLVWCRSDRPWEDAVLVGDAAPDAGGDERTTGSAAAVPSKLKRLVITGSAVAVALGLLLVIALVASRSHGPTTRSPVKPQTLRQPLRADVVALASKLQETLRAKAFLQLSVEARDDKALITGNIRADQQEELETLIQTWKRDNPSIRIALKLADATPATLPFAIVAMVGGSSPSVLASTGESLYLGSESNGFRLVLVNGTCLTFERIDTHQRLKECLAPSSPQR